MTTISTDAQDENDAAAAQMVTATVDIKKFLMFLDGMQINNDCKTICNIVHGKMLKLQIEQPDMFSLQCFLTEISEWQKRFAYLNCDGEYC